VSTLVGPSALYDSLDPRTVEILEQRRRGEVTHRRGWLVRRALLVADLAGLSGAFLIAQELGGGGIQSGSLSRGAEFVVFALSLPAWVVAAKIYGLYDKDEERTDHSTTDDFGGVFHLVTVCTFLLYAVSHLTQSVHPQFSKLFVFWALAIVCTVALRSGARAICRRRLQYLQNAIIVGAGEVGQQIARKLLKHREYGINLVGFVDANPRAPIPGLEHLTLLGAQGDLPELVGLLDVERVIVAFSDERHEGQLDLIRELNALDVQVDVVPRFFDVLSANVDFHTVEGLPMCSLPPPRLSRSSRFIKRGVDMLGAGVCLIVMAPFFVCVALAIRLDSRGPILFRQERTGEHGRSFRIWKFRSMEADAEARKGEFHHLNKHLAPGGDPRMFKIDDDPRVTRVGRVLRRYSIDEIPQILNVLRGEMSLVGPRPLIPTEEQYVDGWAKRRLDLRPGITGLWQVLGRDDIGFDEMVRLDYRYVTNWSLGQDLTLIAKTLPRVISRRP
jgi:exopolysaccharide biosynthesis polyprenyl glycosylphosphotransferase